MNKLYLMLSAAVCAAFLSCAPNTNPNEFNNQEPTGPIVYVMGMKPVSGGTFTMGSPDATLDNNAQPPHPVTVSNFSMDSTDVTQASYLAIMGVNPSQFTGDLNRPVESVTWFDAVLYCNARSKAEGRDTVYTYTSVTGTPGNGCTSLGNIAMDSAKHGYRLPTEAEWEYACRAGTTTGYYWGDDGSAATVAEYAWFESAKTQPVAQKKPNAWGYYDLCGDVYQWCNDWYGSYSPAPIDTAETDTMRGDTAWVRSIRYDTVQVDTVVTDTIVKDTVASDSSVHDSTVYDTSYVRTIVADTLDSLKFFTIREHAIAYDTLPIDTVFNPIGPAAGPDGRVLRGGSWADDLAAPLRSAYRSFNHPNTATAFNGFRCVLR